MFFFVWEGKCNYSMPCISQVPRERRSSTAKPEVEHPDQDHSKRYQFLLLHVCLSPFLPRPPKLLEKRNCLFLLCAPNSFAAPGTGWQVDHYVELRPTLLLITVHLLSVCRCHAVSIAKAALQPWAQPGSTDTLPEAAEVPGDPFTSACSCLSCSRLVLFFSTSSIASSCMGW